MVKAPPWDIPPWRLAQELRPLYAAVNRVHELEANRVPRRQRSLQPSVRCVAAAELTRLVDAMQPFEAKRVTVRSFGRA